MTRTVWATLACVAMAACAAEDRETGDVAVALTAPGANGSTYRLTPGARLELAGGPFYDQFSLDGDGAVQHIDVPPGAYQATLVHDLGYTTEWLLERTNADLTVDVVSATLTTTMPAAIDVVEGAATPLVLSFVVEDAGTITFAHGTVDVSIDVGEVPADAHAASTVGELTAMTVELDPAAPAALAGRMPAVGDVATPAIAVRTTGAWAQSSATGACVDAMVTGYSVGGSTGLGDLIGEASENASLCLTTTGGTTRARILIVRYGAATTATFADLGDMNYQFIAAFDADVPGAFFDGETLRLADLVGTYSVPATMLGRVMARPTGATTPRARWYFASLAGTVTFQFGT